jgi:hypothetical protein
MVEDRRTLDKNGHLDLRGQLDNTTPVRLWRLLLFDDRRVTRCEYKHRLHLRFRCPRDIPNPINADMKTSVASFICNVTGSRRMVEDGEFGPDFSLNAKDFFEYR